MLIILWDWFKPTLGDAVAECQKAVALEGDSPRYIGTLGIAYARAGMRGEAAKILGELQELSRRRYVSPVLIATLVYEMEGKKEACLEALERGYEDRNGSMSGLKTSPFYDPLRSEPRFQALLRKMNFPEK
jgi:hypothetical protein